MTQYALTSTAEQAETPSWETKRAWAISTTIYVGMFLFGFFAYSIFSQYTLNEIESHLAATGALLPVIFYGSFLTALVTALSARKWLYALFNILVLMLILFTSLRYMNVC